MFYVKYILNVLEDSGNYEKLETGNEIIKQQFAKNSWNSHATCSNSLVYPIEKQNNQEILNKELNKHINEAIYNKVKLLSYINKRNDTNKSLIKTKIIPTMKIET